MPINRHAIVQVLQEVSLTKGLKCTLTESFKGALTVGSFAFGGALLGGPIGMGIGGTLGSIYAALSSRGNFKPVATVLSEELSPEQLIRLENSFRAIFQEIDATDVATVTAIIMSSNSMQMLVMKQLGVFLKDEMGLELM